MTQQYRSILKATTIFGGTQVIQILVGLIKAKCVAVLIGAAGMGLNYMYMTSLTMIIAVVGLGLNSSVVRDLSRAYDDGDMKRFAIVAKVFRRMLYVLSIIGIVCVIVLSPQLSQWAFKDTNHAGDYCLLSIVVGFMLLTQGNTAVLISARRVKDTAMSTLWGAVVNLAVSIPLLYFMGIDGVVPALVLSAIANYIVTYLYVAHVKLEKVKIVREHFMTYGKMMIALGAAMILAEVVGEVSRYIINVYVTRYGGLQDLGFFNAGMQLTFQAVSLIFVAMASDYYPRLVASLADHGRMCDTVNQQGEVIMLLAMPILSLFMLLSPVIIAVVLSQEFHVIRDFIRILCFGMLFKAVSYSLGYVSFAKGDTKIYVFFEGLYGSALNMILAIGMYYLWGLTGLAYSFVAYSAIYLISVSMLCRKRYKYSMDKNNVRLVGISVVSLAVMLSLTYLLNGVAYYIVGGILTAAIVYFNLKKLNEKTGVIATIKSKFVRG
jgi:O-antigen/teichoic acid export membrane protein